MEQTAMEWKFDQAPNVACITSQAVLDGSPVLVVTHYSDDHSWAFLDGAEADPAQARVVSMGSIVRLHPDVEAVADLLPGMNAVRSASGAAWHREAHA